MTDTFDLANLPDDEMRYLLKYLSLKVIETMKRKSEFIKKINLRERSEL